MAWLILWNYKRLLFNYCFLFWNQYKDIEGKSSKANWGVRGDLCINEHWISRSFLLLQIVISRYNCSLLFPLYLFFESSHLSCFALMSADSVCLCCSQEDSFRISDLFTVVGVQNATALRLCTEASPPLLCAQSYINAPYNNLKLTVEAASDIQNSTSMSQSWRVSEFHMLSRDTGSLQFLK